MPSGQEVEAASFYCQAATEPKYEVGDRNLTSQCKSVKELGDHYYTHLNKRMGKQTWYTNTVYFYLTIKRSGILIHTITWKYFKNIMFSERR